MTDGGEITHSYTAEGEVKITRQPKVGLSNDFKLSAFSN